MNPAKKRSYCLTPAGAKALAAPRSVPAWYRSILSFVECGMGAEAILGLMTADRPKRVLAWIDELETFGFIADTAREPLG